MADVAEYEIVDIHPNIKTGTTKNNKPYRVFTVQVKNPPEELGDEWPELFWMKDEKPKVGDKIKGKIEKGKFGWKLEAERQGGSGGGYGAAAKTNQGVEIRTAAYAVAGRLLAGTIDPNDEKAWEKHFIPVVDAIAADIRRASDNRISAAQRGLLFGEMEKRDTPKEFEKEVRDLDRDGLLTKEVAGTKIDEVMKFPAGDRETRTHDATASDDPR